MIKTVFEIQIKNNFTIEYNKKYFTKSEALLMFGKIAMKYNAKKFPEILFNQINFDEEGNQLSVKTLKKNHIDINKMSLESTKIILKNVL
jgi:hypothetical protein